MSQRRIAYRHQAVQWEDPTEREEASAPRYADSRYPCDPGLSWLTLLYLANPDPKAGPVNDTEPLADILSDRQARETLREQDWRRLAAMVRELQRPLPLKRGPHGGRRQTPRLEQGRRGARWVRAQQIGWRQQHGKSRVPGHNTNRWIVHAATIDDVVDLLLERAIRSEMKNPKRLGET
jgi:hypothetical protein